MSTPSPTKHFTIDEANHALPLVRAIVADIVRQYRDITERKERLAQIQKSRGPKGRAAGDLYSEEVAQVEEDLEKEVAVLQEYIEELEKLGVEIKDLSRGLVDFRSMLDGREVYLCWLLGEEEVTHWHELDAGFAGRQSLLATSASRTADAEDLGTKGA
ncbi:MAG TPA: DUF2203 domain-containing protein [Planctomycetaceae bacterium]|jgi:hypothetical protein|nr:DUF2203 domain-containing protein [Planctomycetaceae bacterium]